MTFQKVPPITELESTLSSYNPQGKPSTPIAKRMRAAYYLRYHHETLSESNTKTNIINILCKALCNQHHGSLLRHEIAFVLGQLRDPQACPTLIQILDTTDDCIIARHECAEALAAIGCKSSIPILEKYCKDDNPVEIVETCQIALRYLQWKLKNNGKDDEYVVACPCMEQSTIIPLSPYLSVDPAPPHIDPKYINLSNQQLGQILLTPDTNLFHRYRVLFTLRNRADEEAIQELNNVLLNDTSSALLRHEVAYVLGQIQHACSKDALIACLRDREEHRMVRHEAAEALGAVMENYGSGDREERNLCEQVLEEYKLDEELVVSESCIVALDAVDYWNYT